MTTLAIDCLDDRVVAELRHGASGDVIARAAVEYGSDPAAFRVDPTVWLAALERAVDEVLGGASPAAVGVDDVVLCACPKGAVVLDVAGEPVAAALVGDDPDTAPDAKWLTKQLADGADAWVASVGAAPTAAWTASKLSWLHRSDADAWARVTTVLQPQDWLVLQLTGNASTDGRTAAATGYWSSSTGYRLDLLATVDRDRDWVSALPVVAADGAAVGTWRGVPVHLSAA